MKKADLITIAGDLNKILGLDPPIETDKNAKQNSLEEKIAEAVLLLEAGDELEDDTKRHLKTFLNPEEYNRTQLTVMEELDIIDLSKIEEEESEQQEEEKKEAEETEPEEAEEATLEDEIEACTSLRQLKDIAKAEDEFKDLRGVLTKYKTKDDLKDLKDVMFNTLKEEEAEEPEQEEPKKEEKTPDKKTEEKKEVKKEEAPVKKEKKTPKKKGPGVIVSIAECIEKAGKKGISKEEILDALIEKFPDRNKESMSRTIGVQVPGRISKEKFKVEKTKDNKYYKA